MSALTLHSPYRPVRSQAKALYDFLTDFNNLPKVLPHDKVSDFKVTSEGCAFNIQGIAALKMVIDKKTPHSEIGYHISGPAKSVLYLQINFRNEEGKTSTEVHLAAHLNPFLKVMAEKPLKTIVNTINEKLAELDVSAHEQN